MFLRGNKVWVCCWRPCSPSPFLLIETAQIIIIHWVQSIFLSLAKIKIFKWYEKLNLMCKNYEKYMNTVCSQKDMYSCWATSFSEEGKTIKSKYTCPSSYLEVNNCYKLCTWLKTCTEGSGFKKCIHVYLFCPDGTTWKAKQCTNINA